MPPPWPPQLAAAAAAHHAAHQQHLQQAAAPAAAALMPPPWPPQLAAAAVVVVPVQGPPRRPGLRACTVQCPSQPKAEGGSMALIDTARWLKAYFLSGPPGGGGIGGAGSGAR